MSDLEKKEVGKIVQLASDVQFENDFGQEPILMGHIIKDQGVIAVCSLVSFFIGTAITGNPIAGIVLLIAGANDIGYASRKRSASPQPTDAKPQEPIDVEAREVEQKALPIGQETRLNAVEVESEAVAEQQPAAQGGSTHNSPTGTPTLSKLEPVDIALKMAEVPKSTIIAASPRVGKGVVVSQVIAYLRQLHPDLEIWLIDPKNEPTELHYWLLIDPDKRCHFDLRDYDLDPSQASELFEAFLIRFNKSKSSRKLLIIDEFVMLNQKCLKPFTDKLKDFIVGICSSGETSPDQGIGRFVWAITQSPYVSDIGFKTKAALTTFQRVFLLNVPSIQLYSLAASASFVPNGQDKEVADLLEVTGRAFYYSRSNSWHPVPDYQMSHSPGYKSKTLVSPTDIEQGKTGEVLPKSEANDLKISDDLAEPLKSIWLFCKKKNDWVTAKDIYVNGMAVLKGKSVKNIRQYLGLLADKGLGEIDAKDGDKPKSDSAVGFRTY